MRIIKFEQPSCVPCRMVDGLLKHLGLEVDEVLDIAVDENAFNLAQHLGVKSTPTLVLLKENGEVIGRVSGMNQDGIKELFAKRGR